METVDIYIYVGKGTSAAVYNESGRERACKDAQNNSSSGSQQQKEKMTSVKSKWEKRKNKR